MNQVLAKELLQRAGFEIIKMSGNTDIRPYITFTYPDCNSYLGLIHTDQPENTILELIFEHCKRVGRIQVRRELAKIISITNYE